MMSFGRGAVAAGTGEAARKKSAETRRNRNKRKL
jgi:hypothetical protein